MESTDRKSPAAAVHARPTLFGATPTVRAGEPSAPALSMLAPLARGGSGGWPPRSGTGARRRVLAGALLSAGAVAAFLGLRPAGLPPAVERTELVAELRAAPSGLPAASPPPAGIPAMPVTASAAVIEPAAPTPAASGTSPVPLPAAAADAGQPSTSPAGDAARPLAAPAPQAPRLAGAAPAAGSRSAGTAPSSVATAGKAAGRARAAARGRSPATSPRGPGVRPAGAKDDPDVALVAALIARLDRRGSDPLGAPRPAGKAGARSHPCKAAGAAACGDAPAAASPGAPRKAGAADARQR